MKPKTLAALALFLAISGALAAPAQAHAAPAQVLIETDSFALTKPAEHELVFSNKATGETVTARGSLVKNGDTLTITNEDGAVSVARLVDGTVYLDGRAFIANVPLRESRACVKNAWKRYTVDTRVGGWVTLLLSSAAGAIGGPPASYLAGLIATLQASAPTTAYIETIRYYCDTPTPRERYVTNYYSDAGYKKLVHTYTSEVVFQKP